MSTSLSQRSIVHRQHFIYLAIITRMPLNNYRHECSNQDTQYPSDMRGYVVFYHVDSIKITYFNY